MPNPRTPDRLRDLHGLDPAPSRPSVGDSPPRAPRSLSAEARPLWAYYVRAFPGLRPPDRDVLAVFCEQIVLFRDLQAALRDYPPGSAEAMRIRRDLKSATVEIRQYAHALGFTPKSREHLTAPEPPTPDLEDWMRP